MNKNTIWTVVGVILAVVIAWWLVGVVFSVLWFFAKLAIVAVVAGGVFIALRMLFRKSDS